MKVYNFSAGPAVIPADVLNEIHENLISFKGSGISILEESHRGHVFEEIASESERDLRELLAIPENYKILFLMVVFLSIR